MSEVQVISYRPETGQYAWTFGGAEPVMRIRTSAVLEVFTEDCFAGRVQGENDLVSRGRCCRWVTGTPARARARPAGWRSRRR